MIFQLDNLTGVTPTIRGLCVTFLASSLFVSVAYQFCSLLFGIKVIDLWADDAFYDSDYIMY